MIKGRFRERDQDIYITFAVHVVAGIGAEQADAVHGETVFNMVSFLSQNL